jgi:hypothetical protein
MKKISLPVTACKQYSLPQAQHRQHRLHAKRYMQLKTK